MNIAQTIQNGPARAVELFSKLADTSDGAVKTREKLFSDLKDELELLARLEEEHLFPVLRKHPETKDLVSEARKDNKQVRALLVELDHMSKEGEDFLKRIAELRRVFQQHVRDEKKELLPAVRKALSDEEAQAVIEGIEAGRQEVETAKRQEIDERRAEARREREEEEQRQAEAEVAQREEARQRRAEARREREEEERQQAEAAATDRRAREAARTARTAVNETANASQHAARAGAEIAERGTETVQQIVQSTVQMATQATERSVEQFAQVFGFPGRQSEETAQQSSQNIEIVAEASTVLAQGVQEISREWLSLAQNRFQRNLDGFNELLGCRSMPDLIAVQSRLLRENLELMVSSSRRIAELSVEVTDQAAQKITARADENARRAHRAA